MNDEINNLIESCENFDGASNAFSEIVSSGLEVLDVRQEDFANEFQVAISTISRWAAGKNMPHPAVRNFVVNQIAERAKRAKPAAGSGRNSGTLDSGVFAVAAKSQ